MAVYEGDYIKKKKKKKKSSYICLNPGRLQISDFWSLRYFSYSANVWHIWAHHSFGFFVFLISYKVVLILTAFFFTVIRYYLLNLCVNDLSAFTHFYDFFFKNKPILVIYVLFEFTRFLLHHANIKVASRSTSTCLKINRPYSRYPSSLHAL